MTQDDYVKLLKKFVDEDALQQAWLELQARDPGLDLQSIDRRLLIGRAKFRIADQHRRRRRAGYGTLASLLNFSSDEKDPVVSSAIDKETKEEVRRAVETLSPTFREIAILLWFDGLTPEEVALRTGLKRKTVYTRRRRAVQRLRTRLTTRGL
tara:strand:- start:98135 stop:98593 length:459 start_codon:yes stop_codon:yes gene_type:complete